MVVINIRLDGADLDSYNTAGLYINSGSNKNIIMVPDSNSTSGRVGIGTNDPQQKLHVQGDINFTGNLYQRGSLFSGGVAFIDLRELGSMMLVKVFCLIKIPKSPNLLLWIIENSSLLIFNMIILYENQVFGCI